MSDDHEPATFDDDESTAVVQSADVGGFFGGRFRIDHRLGVGAMGRVLSALDTQTGQLVALKVLHRDRSKDPDVLRRFGREARALSAIAHPAIVGIVASGRAPDGTPWLAMEHLVGKTLKDRMKAVGPMSVAELWPIIRTLAEAMAAAHAAGVVHRDLKPENVFLPDNPPPVVKILDFGLSRLSRENDQRFTKTGQVLGTPRYMAPELLHSGKPPDQRIDVFALGVIAFEALTGQSMYTADDLGSLFGQILEGRTRTLRSLRPDLSETLEGLLQQATARDPDERFGTVTAFVTAFGHASGHHDAPAPPKPIALAELFDDVTTGAGDQAPLLDPFSGTAVAPKPVSSAPVRSRAATAMGVAPGEMPRPGPAAGFLKPAQASGAVPAQGVRASLKPAPVGAGVASRPSISGPDGWAHGPTPSAPMRPPIAAPQTPAAGQLRPRAMTPAPVAPPLAATVMPVAGQEYPPAAARAELPTLMPTGGQQYPPSGAGLPAVTMMSTEAMMAAPAPSLGAAAAPGSLQFSAPRSAEPASQVYVQPAPAAYPQPGPAAQAQPVPAPYPQSYAQPQPYAAAPPSNAGFAPQPGPASQPGFAPQPGFGAQPGVAPQAGFTPQPGAAGPAASFSLPAPAAAPAPVPAGAAARPPWVFWALFGVAAIVVVVVASAGALALRWALVHGHL